MGYGKLKSAMCAAAMFSAAIVSNQANAEDVLLVGTESSYAPFEFTDQSGKLVGFDIDLTEAIAAELGMKVKWMQMPFDGLIPAMLTGQVDMAAASFTVTEERKKRINFSDPYYTSGLTFVIRAADVDKYPNNKSLEGQKLCAQLGSVSAMKAQTISPDKVITFNDAYAAYLELQSGGCEAVLNDRPVNQYFLSTVKNPEQSHEIDEVMDSENMALVVPKNNPELLKKINKALLNLKNNGGYQKVYNKWFKPTAVNVEPDSAVDATAPAADAAESASAAATDTAANKMDTATEVEATPAKEASDSAKPAA